MRRVLCFIALVSLMLLLHVPVGHADTFTATLLGPSESPPNASPGTGTAFVEFDIGAHTLHVTASFSGLLGSTTASHIHCCVDPPGNAGVATTVPSFPGFPLGVTAGIYDFVFDTTLASTYNPAFVTSHGGTIASAEAALFSAMVDGDTYFNIHTNVFPGGEIRGFLTPLVDGAVPAPTALALLAAGLTGVGVARGMRRR